LKLIACSNCHTQYDVTEMASGSHFDCRCGVRLEATASKGADAQVQRCSACGALAREEDETCAYCEAEIVHLGDVGSLICPECFARNADDARFCLACGVGFAPERVQSQKSELRCPCCERWMMSREVGGVEIQECEKCHGLWAPEDRFESLVERATKLARERGEQSNDEVAPRVDGGNPVDAKVEYRRCPECDALMTRRNFRKRSGVIVDRCHEHGTWLDAHELERIAGFVLSGRAERIATDAAASETERERNAAREAARRMLLGSADHEERADSIFTTRRDRTAVGTIFDLLQSLLT
jgi:Zn-finger nucleic acid-binding protein